MTIISSTQAKLHAYFDGGLFPLPRLRVFCLVGVSVLLFFFVVGRLLPSAEVRVMSREDTISRTANIFLVLSGSLADVPRRVRVLPLIPLTAVLQETVTFDQISKKFMGMSAEVWMTIVNTSAEEYSFQKGTRFMNQAGVIVRLQESVRIPVGGTSRVRAKADEFDVYGEIIGERGNIPAGLKWEIPGLSKEERTRVYGENLQAGTGGTTLYSTVLRAEDLQAAQRMLEQELLTAAKQMVEEERVLWNAQKENAWLEILYYPELTRLTYADFILPKQFIGEEVRTVPVEGRITYTVLAYDAQALLDLLSDELTAHVRDEREIMPDTFQRDRLTVHVIDYADDISWVKLTVDLNGKERYVLDQFSPTGVVFGRRVREKIAGLSQRDALQILRNMPEVQKAEISLWPPWNTRISTIPSHIVITEQ
ncbi:hypothetical protein A3H90_01370 [Candidatus Peribacteria bacterium RIFCSPLOWO2_02_FULL_55_36]|nr:MAG: hypothetical protein A3H90_01370 [Candidatus Peribacteria bacterium RIFCSPLOWO2_02_FULL_55_36]